MSRTFRAAAFALLGLLLSARVAPLWAAPVLHWQFDESAGSAIAVNSAGGGGNGTLTNMDVNAAWIPGKVGGALNFDGSDDYVNVGVVAAANFGQTGTVVGWINLDDNGNIHTIYNSNTPNNGFQFRTESGGGNLRLIKSNIVGFGTANSNVSAGEWHHVAVSFDNGTAVYYLDGKQDGSVFLAQSFDFNNVLIGAQSPNVELMKGAIDDLAVFDTALTPAHIATLRGLAEHVSVDAGQIAVDNVLAAFNTQTGFASAGGLYWEYATGLSGVLGDIGVLGSDPYIVLDDLGNGVLGLQPPPAPEPSTILLLGGSLCALAARRRKRRG